MSYEGYVQHICTHGHRYDKDVYEPEQTCHCGSPSAWHNSVDLTNGDSYGRISSQEFERFLREPAVVETCNLGCQHITKEATYNIPYHSVVRQYHDWRTDSWAPINRQDIDS